MGAAGSSPLEGRLSKAETERVIRRSEFYHPILHGLQHLPKKLIPSLHNPSDYRIETKLRIYTAPSSRCTIHRDALWAEVGVSGLNAETSASMQTGSLFLHGRPEK